MNLSRRVVSASASATLAMKAEADRLRASGVNLVDLGLGEPDFDTPRHIKEAALRALEENRTHYTTVEGIPELRRAIVERYRAAYGVRYGEDEVFVASGAKGALFALLQAIVDEGDEVVVFQPYWSSYPEQVKLAGGTPRLASTYEASGFVPRAASLEAALGARTRAVILNSPCNPTGALLRRQEWDAIVDVLAARSVILICDEVYESFVYEGEPFISGATFRERLGDRLLVVSSVSKSYAMTGWRLGYALGPREVIAAAARVQSHDASQAPTLSQYAALAALSGSQEPLAAMLAEYARRRAFLVPALRKIRGVTCATPQGAFYAFPGVAGLYAPMGARSSEEVAATLIREAAVMTVPGEGFGAPGYLRISYAAPMSALAAGVERIASLVARLS